MPLCRLKKKSGLSPTLRKVSPETYAHVDKQPADIARACALCAVKTGDFNEVRHFQNFHDTNIRFLSHLNLFKTYY